MQYKVTSRWNDGKVSENLCASSQDARRFRDRMREVGNVVSSEYAPVRREGQPMAPIKLAPRRSPSVTR